MVRYIDAEILTEEIRSLKIYLGGKDVFPDTTKESVLRVIDEQPTADVVEAKHGEWKQGVPYVCSICGKPAPDEKNTSERYSCWISPYCPHCGAKMNGGNAE